MKVAEKNTVGGSHDMATADNRLDARRKRCKIGVDDGPFNANGNICCPSGKSRFRDIFSPYFPSIFSQGRSTASYCMPDSSRLYAPRLEGYLLIERTSRP
jgi:hypothetical protein